MDTASYKKAVFQTLSVKEAKAGLKAMLNNKLTLNIGHAIIGVNTEVGELIQAASRFVLGFQITEEVRRDCEEELGDILYYTTVGAKMLKLKMPSSSKKIKPKATMTELILRANSIATDLLSLYKKIYYGRGLGAGFVKLALSDEEQAAANAKAAEKSTPEKPVVAKTIKKVPHDSQNEALAKAAELWAELIPTIYSLCWILCNKTPAEIMDSNIAKLSARYPEGFFTQSAAEARADKQDLAA